jgi:hypothetical protein
MAVLKPLRHPGTRLGQDGNETLAFTCATLLCRYWRHTFLDSNAAFTWVSRCRSGANPMWPTSPSQLETFLLTLARPSSTVSQVGSQILLRQR